MGSYGHHSLLTEEIDCLVEECSDDFEKQFFSELMNGLDSDDGTDFEAPAFEFREDDLHNEAVNDISVARDEVLQTECVADEVGLHAGNVEYKGLSMENINFSDISETSSKLLGVTGVRSNCSESDVPKHMEGADSNAGVRVAEAEEAKSMIVEESGCQQEGREGCELQPRLICTSGGSSDYPVEEGNDTNSIENLSAESLLGNVGEKGDVNTETGMLPSSICAISLEGLSTEGSLGNSPNQDEENDENSVLYRSAERESEVMHRKIEVDGCTYISHSLSDHVQQHDPDDINGVSSSSVPWAREVTKDKDDAVIRAEVVTCTNRFPVDRNSCNFKEGSQNITFGDDAEIPLLPDACPLISNSSDGPSKTLDVLNDNFIGTIITEPCSSITTGRFELKGDEDNEGRDNVCSGGSMRAKTSEYMCQTRQRSLRSGTSRRASKNEVVSKKVRKTVHKASFSHESIEVFSMVSKMKRSCLSKSRRSSVWGSPSNLLDLFEVNNQHAGHKLRKQGSQDPQNLRCGREHKRNDNQEGRSSSDSKEKGQSVTGRICVKIKIGKKSISSVMILTSKPENTSTTDHEVIGKNSHGALDDISGDEVSISRPIQCIEKQAENLELQQYASNLDVNLYDKKFESTINLCKSPRDETGGMEVEVADGTENRHVDSGTSPDSEVINQSPDALVGLRVQESSQDAPMTSSSDLASTGDIKQLNLPRMSSKKGRKKDKAGLGNFADVAASISSEQSKKRGDKKGVDGFNSHEISEKIEKLPPSSKMKGHTPTKSFKSRGNGKLKSDNPDVMGSTRENAFIQEEIDRHTNEKEVPEVFFGKVESYPDTGILGIDDSGRANASDKSGSEDKSNLDMVQNGELESSGPPRNAWVSCDECQKWRRIPATLADSIEETNSKWTCIDNMDKAFANCSTPQEKSNSEINAELDISDAEDSTNGGITNSKGLERRHTAASQPSSWTLIKSNLFKHRRRKTQAIDEIMVCYCKTRANGRPGCGGACLNRLLNIECVRGTCPCGDSCSNQQFQKHNYAKLKCFRCGKKGYGLQLLEDISKGQFLIEYVGEVLDLHAYEARQLVYASMGHTHFYFMTLNGAEVIDACAKGNLGRFINHSCDPNCRTEKWMVNGEICIGLFAIRDIKKGEELTFDYNYVRVFGAAVKKCVCGSSQCRGYIGGDPSSTEVIVQGDSDDEYPEPVMVLENGGKINTLDSLAVKANSYIQEDKQTGEASKGRNSIDESTGAAGQLEITREKVECTQSSAAAATHLKSSSEYVTHIEIIPSSIQLIELPIKTEEVSSKLIPMARRDTIDNEEGINQSLCPPELESPVASIPEKSISDSHDDCKISQSDKVKDGPVSSKSLSMIKKAKSPQSAKKEKQKTALVSANKSQLTPNKTKKTIERTVTGRYEAVEEKLNELLDADGGISKQKDASKGYLKLLLLTAASGDSVNGEAIQSNRELSMLLEVLLKTKSRVVLVDIINKNGLRMLHNIMKQSRKEYTKTPILRKLLKVLEYLATKGILTSDHINVGPPCPGMESFRKSILTLTEHSNKQVHQIARGFRDRWLRQPSRKNECGKRDDGRKGSNGNRISISHRQDRGIRASEATDTKVSTKPSFAASSSGIQEEGCARNGVDGLTSDTKTRKRKSRWDEPAPTSTDLVSPPNKEQKIEPNESIVRPELSILVLNDECMTDYIRQEAIIRANDSGGEPLHEDAPPGFCFPPDTQLVSPSISIDLPDVSIGHVISTLETVTAHPQERFRSCLPVSYGIPLSLLQQNGIPKTVSVDGWTNAPGIAFHPFPPLPSYPRNERNPSSCSVKYLNENEAGGVQSARCGSATDNMDQSSQSTSSAALASATNNQYGFDRARMNSIDSGKRFMQQKWNDNKFAPPWSKRRSKWDQVGTNPRNGMFNMDIDSVQNEPKDLYFSEDMGRRMQHGRTTIYQQQNRQYH